MCVGADSLTLSLLVTLLNPEIRPNQSTFLLLVGSYRDNEVDDSHGLTIALREIAKKGGRMEDIQLLPLNEPDVVQLLDDTFNIHGIKKRERERTLLILIL